MEASKPKKNRNVAMLTFSHFESDPRVKREAYSLTKENYQVYVISLRDNDEPRRVSYQGVEVIKTMKWVQRIRKKAKLKYLVGFTLFVAVCFFELTMLSLRRKKLSVIHIHNPPDHLVLAALPSRIFCRSRIILDRHEPFATQIISQLNRPTTGFLFKLLVFYERLIGFFANTIFVINIPDEEHMRKLLPKKIIQLIRNSLDTSNLEHLTKEKPDANVFTLLYQGLIAKRRDIDTIIYAINELKGKIENFKCVILGDGEYKHEMLNLIAKFDLEEIVEYRGFIEYNKLMKEISRADVCLLTAKDLPIYQMYVPNKLFEYMFYEKPIIASDLPYLNYLSEGVCYFYKSSDFKDLAKQIIYVFENEDDVTKKIEKMPEVLGKNLWSIDEKKMLTSYNKLIEKN